MTQFEVEKILVEQGKVVGVSTKNLKDNSRVLFQAPMVIGDLKVWEYFEKGLLEENEFPNNWLIDVKRMKQWRGAAVHIWWGSNRTIPRYHEILGNAEKGVRWSLLEDHEATEAYTKNMGGVAPTALWTRRWPLREKIFLPDGYWFSTEEGAPWNQASEAFYRGLGQLRNLVEKGFKENFDKVTEFIRKEYHSPTWSCENYSIYPRPGLTAPTVEGLYFVGDSVEGDGVGASQPVRVCSVLISYWRTDSLAGFERHRWTFQWVSNRMSSIRRGEAGAIPLWG